MLATSIRLPTAEEVKRLSVTDITIAAGLAHTMRQRFNQFVHVDHYCLPDPFAKEDDYSYSIVLDKENPNRVVAILASSKDSLPQLPWSTILEDRLVKLPISKDDASTLKYELMPKLTNNFYPYRRNGRIAGYVMFAFQICGQR